MLVLTRKRGEKVLIDGGITVEVLETRDNKVRLGFKAPRAVGILREEVKPRGASDGCDNGTD